MSRLLTAPMTFAIGVILTVAVLDLPEIPAGLTPTVLASMEMSGVGHPVTGVLLNFRGYDTWLEVGVLLLAMQAVLLLQRSYDLSLLPSDPPANPVLSWFTHLLVPAMVLVAGYLLWMGTKAPGGAFQAGAILGAAGVLLRLAGYRSVAVLRGVLMRALLLMGFGLFLVVAVGVMAFGMQFFQYPGRPAGEIIFALEIAISVATGLTLAALFVGGRPARRHADGERRGSH